MGSSARSRCCRSRAVLAAQKLRNQERSDGDRGIGQIERRPDKTAGVQLQKIGDAAVQQAIEQIPAAPPAISARPACAQRAARAARRASSQTSRITTAAAAPISRNGDPLRGGFDEQAESDAGIHAVHQRGEVRDQFAPKTLGV